MIVKFILYSSTHLCSFVAPQLCVWLYNRLQVVAKIQAAASAQSAELKQLGSRNFTAWHWIRHQATKAWTRYTLSYKPGDFMSSQFVLGAEKENHFNPPRSSGNPKKMLLKHSGNKGIKPIWSLRNCQELPVSGISLLGQVCPACRGRPNCFCIWIRGINIPSRVQRLLASNLHHSKQLILRFTCPYSLAQWQGFKVNRENNEQRTPSWHRRWARGQDQPGACPVAAVPQRLPDTGLYTRYVLGCTP